MDKLARAIGTPDTDSMLVTLPHDTSGTMWWARHDDSASTGTHAEGKTAFAAVVAFTFILLLSPQNWFPALAPLRIAFLAAGFAVVSLLWERFQRGTPLRFTKEAWFCLALLSWAFLTLPLSYWPGGSIKVLTEVYIKALLVFWLLANLVTSERRMRFLATVLILCSVPLSFTALKNFATGTFIGGSQSPEGRIVGYDAGVASNPNDLALMLNLVIPLGVALFFSAEKTSSRILFLIVVGINAMGVIFTYSRAGFLGLAAVGIFYFVKLVRRPGSDRSWAFAMLLLALLSLPFLPSNYTDRIATIADIDADPTGSAQERWQDSVEAAHFVAQHPVIGAGIGMDMLALNEVRGARWKQVHNVYLQYAVDLGLPGLILFLLLFYGVFRAVRTSCRRAASLPGSGSLFRLSEGLEVSLVVFVVAGFFHPVAYHFYFYYFGGLALAARSATDSLISTNESDWKLGTRHPHGGRPFIVQDLP